MGISVPSRTVQHIGADACRRVFQSVKRASFLRFTPLDSSHYAEPREPKYSLSSSSDRAKTMTGGYVCMTVNDQETQHRRRTQTIMVWERQQDGLLMPLQASCLVLSLQAFVAVNHGCVMTDYTLCSKMKHLSLLWNMGGWCLRRLCFQLVEYLLILSQTRMWQNIGSKRSKSDNWKRFPGLW